MNLRAAALIAITTVTWAGAWISARIATGYAPAEWTAVGRFVIAALALAVARPIFGSSGMPKGNQWRLLLGMAMTGAIGYNLFFLFGVKYAPASDGSIIAPGLTGLFGVLFVFLFYQERPRMRALQGGFLSLAGVTLVGIEAARSSGITGDRMLGAILFVCGAAVWGLYTAFGRKASKEIGAIDGIFWTCVLGAVILAPYAWWHTGAPEMWDRIAFANMIFLGLGSTALGFVSFYLSVQEWGIDRVGPTLGFVPVVGVLGAWVILDEPISVFHLAGAFLVVLGVLRASGWKPRARGQPVQIQS